MLLMVAAGFVVFRDSQLFQAFFLNESLWLLLLKLPDSVFLSVSSPGASAWPKLPLQSSSSREAVLV